MMQGIINAETLEKFAISSFMWYNRKALYYVKEIFELSKKFQQEILEDIKRINQKIDEIYYLQDFESGDGFRKRCETLKNMVLNVSNENNIAIGTMQFIINEIIKLEFEVDNYFKDNFIQITQLKREKSIKKIDQIMTRKGRTTKELWQDLKEMSDKWKKTLENFSEAEKQVAIEKFADVALRIFKKQIQQGEEIDFSFLNGICEIKDLIEVIKRELIEKARDSENQEDILKFAEEIN